MEPVSLAVALCTICVNGYRSFQTLRTLGTDAQVILSKLEIQEYRLQDLGRTLNKIKESAFARDLELVMDPICNTLKSIELLTTDAAHLRTQYKLKLEITTTTESEEADGDVNDASCAVVKVRRSKIWKWLVFDKANMEKLAWDLKYLTDGLERLLSDGCWPQISVEPFGCRHRFTRYI
jgi:hypothetical protein